MKTTTSEEPVRLHDPLGATSWEASYTDSFNGFRQGHILDNIPLIYMGAPTSLWLGPSQAIGALHGSLEARTEEPIALRRGMITTQGCDICKKTHPWIGVVPVYDATNYFDSSRIGNVANGKVDYLLPLTPPSCLEGEKWVADMRIEIPVEKSILLHREPVAAYRDEKDYGNVARRLAYLRQRPDVAEACLDHVAKPLFSFFRAKTAEVPGLGELLDHVRIFQDNPMQPTQVQAILILRNAKDRDDWADVWNEANEAVYEAGTQAGLMLLPIKVVTMFELTAAEYVSSHEVSDSESS